MDDDSLVEAIPCERGAPPPMTFESITLDEIRITFERLETSADSADVCTSTPRTVRNDDGEVRPSESREPLVPVSDSEPGSPFLPELPPRELPIPVTADSPGDFINSNIVTDTGEDTRDRYGTGKRSRGSSLHGDSSTRKLSIETSQNSSLGLSRLFTSDTTSSICTSDESFRLSLLFGSETVTLIRSLSEDSLCLSLLYESEESTSFQVTPKDSESDYEELSDSTEDVSNRWYQYSNAAGHTASLASTCDDIESIPSEFEFDPETDVPNYVPPNDMLDIGGDHAAATTQSAHAVPENDNCDEQFENEDAHSWTPTDSDITSTTISSPTWWPTPTEDKRRVRRFFIQRATYNADPNPAKEVSESLQEPQTYEITREVAASNGTADSDDVTSQSEPRTFEIARPGESSVPLLTDVVASPDNSAETELDVIHAMPSDLLQAERIRHLYQESLDYQLPGQVESTMTSDAPTANSWSSHTDPTLAIDFRELEVLPAEDLVIELRGMSIHHVRNLRRDTKDFYRKSKENLKRQLDEVEKEYQRMRSTSSYPLHRRLLPCIGGRRMSEEQQRKLDSLEDTLKTTKKCLDVVKEKKRLWKKVLRKRQKASMNGLKKCMLCCGLWSPPDW